MLLEDISLTAMCRMNILGRAYRQKSSSEVLTAHSVGSPKGWAQMGQRQGDRMMGSGGQDRDLGVDCGGRAPGSNL